MTKENKQNENKDNSQSMNLIDEFLSSGHRGQGGDLNSRKNLSEKSNTRCGFVTIVGRPNVGKSTLINHIFGSKLAIISPKPQTTQHAMQGIVTLGNSQIIFTDTPGIHQKQVNVLNTYMNNQAISQLEDTDLILWVLDSDKWQSDDGWVLSHLQKSNTPMAIVFNKIDTMNPNAILPYIKEIEKKIAPKEAIAFIPISALKEKNLETLMEVIQENLPEGDFLYGVDAISNRDENFFVSEFVREQLVRQLGKELPYSCTVVIDEIRRENKQKNTKYRDKKKEEKKEGKEGKGEKERKESENSANKEIIYINATIFVEREGQKKIVIGDKGEGLKRIGSISRTSLERFLGTQVMLRLWVKVKDNWNQDARKLKQLGYDL